MKLLVNYDEEVRRSVCRRALNESNLDDLTITRDDGSEVVIDPESLELFRFTGLSNASLFDYLTVVPRGDGTHRGYIDVVVFNDE